MRGWAAVGVCIYHFGWELFGVRFPELRNIVSATLFNGSLSVSVFFVISGFVLTVDGWSNPAAVRRHMARRYSRLAIPVIAATIVVALLMIGGLTAHLHTAAAVLDSEDWLGSFLRFDFDLGRATYFALVGTFIFGLYADWYHPFLWTMTLELFGSYIILAICLIRWKWLAVGLLVLLTAAFLLQPIDFASGGACFMLGALLSRYRDLLRRLSLPVVVGVVAVLMVIGGWLLLLDDPYPWTTHVIGLLIVATFVAGPSRLLTDKVSSALGKLSFPLYLAQFPVLVGLTSLLVAGTSQAGTLMLPTALAIIVASLAATFVAAIPFLWVERLTAIIGRLIAGPAPRAATP